MMGWGKESRRRRDQESREAAKRLEQACEAARFWESQYDLLYQRCAPYGVIGCVRAPQTASERSKEQVDLLCRVALNLSRHWDEALDAGYPKAMPFAQWVYEVLLPWQEAMQKS